MYGKGKDVMYYITVMNEKYKMPAMPKYEGIEEGIINGMYKFKGSEKNKHRLYLLGSGAILNEVLKAEEILNEYDIYPEVWSITSYKKLYDDAIESQRAKGLGGKDKKSYIEKCFDEEGGIFIAASDYVKALPLSVSQWFPGTFNALGTDGFGLSEAEANYAITLR